MDTLDPSITAYANQIGAGFPELATREFRAFHNGLRILHGLDPSEIDLSEEAFTERDAGRMVRDPVGFFIRANDEKRDAIWRALQKRQPADLRVPAAADVMTDRDPLRLVNRAGNAPHAAEQDERARELVHADDQGLGR